MMQNDAWDESMGHDMKAITLRNLPPDVARAVKQKARKERLSLNRAIIRLLEETTGGSQGKKEIHHDLDHLAGRWSEQEYQGFMEALRGQRRIDPEMWR
jgi:hypothetical protein